MKTLLKYELKTAFKNWLIWTLAVGGMGLICILLYKSMEANISEMAESFANMGAFSDAFGMSTLSMATPMGYFATEIGTIHALGGCMFAASIATVILSKEEDGHTAEFTFTLPIKREKVIIEKFISVLVLILGFTVVCTALYVLGFLIIGVEKINTEFYTYMGFQFMMNIEVATICFLISAINKKNKLGVGIGLAMVLYIADIMSRVIPDLEKIKWISPFSYANAADIFSKVDLDEKAIITSVVITVAAFIISFFSYTKRDLAS